MRRKILLGLLSLPFVGKFLKADQFDSGDKTFFPIPDNQKMPDGKYWLAVITIDRAVLYLRSDSPIERVGRFKEKDNRG